MNMKLALVVLAACVCAAYGGAVASLGYAHRGLGLGYAAGLGYAHGLGYSAGVVAAAPAIAAAPAVTYAAPAVHAYAAPAVHAYAAPLAVYDNTHFNYGYLQPYGNGHVAVSRTGPLEAHSYSFNSGAAAVHKKILL